MHPARSSGAAMVRAACAIVFAALAITLPASAQNSHRLADEWWSRAWTFQSERYDLRTDLDRPDAEALARHMDVMFDHYSRILSGMNPRKDFKLQLLLFRRQSDYAAVVDARYDAKPQGTAGMAIRDKSRLVLVVWKENNSLAKVKRTLQHEGFHQFAASLFPDIPAWADEGIAELCETAVVLDDQVIFGEVDSERVGLLRQAAAAGRLIPIESLFRIDDEDWVDHVNAGEGNLQYAQAWALVHFFLFGDEGRRQQAFNRFLTIMNQGQSWETAFFRAFETRDLDSLQRRQQDYIAQLHPTDLQETIRRLDFLAAGLAALHERGQHPKTMDELSGALKELGFSHPSELFEQTRLMKATDAVLFTVPRAGEAKSEAVFEIFQQVSEPEKPKRSRPAHQGSRRDSESKAAPKSPDNPSIPPAVGTKGLFPFDLAATWSVAAPEEPPKIQIGLR